MELPTVIRSDHREISNLLREVQSTDRKQSHKRKSLAKQVAESFAVHIQLEEQVVYPVAEQQAGAKDAVLKANEEHTLLKQLLEQVRSMDPQEEAFDAKVSVLAELTETHVRHEEEAIVAPVKQALTRGQLSQLAERFDQGRTAVTNPKEYLRASE